VPESEFRGLGLRNLLKIEIDYNKRTKNTKMLTISKQTTESDKPIYDLNSMRAFTPTEVKELYKIIEKNNQKKK
jgi:hypothetical protein